MSLFYIIGNFFLSLTWSLLKATKKEWLSVLLLDSFHMVVLLLVEPPSSFVAPCPKVLRVHWHLFDIQLRIVLAKIWIVGSHSIGVCETRHNWVLDLSWRIISFWVIFVNLPACCQTQLLEVQAVNRYCSYRRTIDKNCWFNQLGA